MTEWPNPKANIAGDILKILVEANELMVPRVRLETGVDATPEELESTLKKLVMTGCVTTSDKWVHLERSAILATLRSELGIG